MDIEQQRKKSQIVIWANPRGVFLTIHADDDDIEPTIDAKHFASWNEMLDWIAAQLVVPVDGAGTSDIEASAARFAPQLNSLPLER